MGNASSGPETVWFHDFEKELPSLEGKTIVVTGCTSGTGLVVARTSVRKAAKDVLMLNRPSERAEKAEKEVKEAIPEGTKVNVETIPCDLQDFESVKNAINRITEKYESIDVLCNNAGVSSYQLCVINLDNHIIGLDTTAAYSHRGMTLLLLKNRSRT